MDLGDNSPIRAWAFSACHAAARTWRKALQTCIHSRFQINRDRSGLLPLPTRSHTGSIIWRGACLALYSVCLWGGFHSLSRRTLQKNEAWNQRKSTEITSHPAQRCSSHFKEQFRLISYAAKHLQPPSLTDFELLSRNRERTWVSLACRLLLHHTELMP